MLTQLIEWSQNEFASLPWRKRRSLYTTLVSEIMLQQTTVSTVKNHFHRFIERFPDLESLAKSTEDEMLVAWKGLGYYRRARNLKKIAEALVHVHGGKFPKDAETLQKIPGIGPYTASALVAIGMDAPALAVDANLERVIARFYGLKEKKGPGLQQEIRRLFEAGKIFPDRKLSPRGLNEALMDLGRTFCQARKASCELCLLRTSCAAFKSGSPLLYPAEGLSKETKGKQHEVHLLRVFVMKKDLLLVYRKDEGEWLTGQCEVPTFILSSTDKDLKQYPRLKQGPSALASYKTGITKYKITNSIAVMSERELKKIRFPRKMEWVRFGDETSNLSTATSKGLQRLL